MWAVRDFKLKILYRKTIVNSSKKEGPVQQEKIKANVLDF